MIQDFILIRFCQVGNHAIVLRLQSPLVIVVVAINIDRTAPPMRVSWEFFPEKSGGWVHLEWIKRAHPWISEFIDKDPPF